MKLLLLAAALWAAAAAWEPAVKPPKGWSARPGDGGATVLSGPQAELPLAPLISIRRYPKDGPEFKDAAAYLKAQAEPGIVKIKGQKPAQAGRVKAGKRELERVTRFASEFIPPASMNAVEVPLREEHVVVPARDAFVVLVYAAPEKGFERNRKVFQRVLESVAAREGR